VRRETARASIHDQRTRLRVSFSLSASTNIQFNSKNNADINLGGLMSNTSKKLGLYFAATSMAALMAAPAVAQAQPAAEGARLEEIVVTAQKREESLQSVPISISAVSSAELQNRSVSQISDLASATPNVTFASTPQSTSATTIGIRGLRSTSVELTNDQPAAIYIDDVYQSSALGSMSFLGPDVERVEVLRGPQGTLFGRNTLAGALSIHSKRPVLDEFSGRVLVGAGNHGLIQGQGMLNVPLAKDLAALRLNLGYSDNNGFAKETTYGRRLGQTKQVYVRGQVRIVPNDQLDVLLAGDYIDAKTDGNIMQLIYLRPGGLAASALGRFYGLNPATPDGFAAIQANLANCGFGATPNLHNRCWSQTPPTSAFNSGDFAGANNQGDISTYKDKGVSANISYQVTDDIQIKSITAYRKFSQNSPKDYDATPSILLFSRAQPKGETFTQEGQLNGTGFDSKLKYTAGVYYYKFKGLERGTNTALVSLIGSNSNFLHNDLHNRSIGVVGQATYAITDEINLTGGLRYTDEKKQVSITQRSISQATGVNTCTVPLPNAQCFNDSTLKYNSTDWTAGIDYTPMEGTMVYARAAKGFQAGGINQRSTVGVPFKTYLPMTAINYEIGFKADMLDRRLRLNVSAFQTDVKNFQQTIAQTFLNSAGATVSVVATLNATSAKLRGFEADLTAIPFKNAKIFATLGHTSPKYGKFFADGPAGPNTLDLSDTDFKAVSKWTFSLSPSYVVPTDFGEIRFQVDYTYQSKMNLAPSLSFPRDQELPVPGLIQKGYGLLNARVAAKIGDQTELALWAKNLTDERYFTSGLNLAASTGFANASVGDPRTFGVQFTQSF